MEATTIKSANNGKANNVNTTTVCGFIATEPVAKTFKGTSVIRFALAVRNRTTNKATGQVTTQSSLITVEKWAKNTNLKSFETIRKGILVEVKGQLKPNEWTGKDGSHRSRIILGARSVKEIARPASQMAPAEEPVAAAS